MAGLLDVFGTGGGESLSLLGMTPEDIKRAQADAQAQALYALAGRLFQGGKTGQSIAQGLQMGQQAYQQAMKGQMADRLQMAQLQQMQQQRAEAEAAKRRQMFVEQRIAGAYQPEVTTETPLMDITGQQVMGPNVPQPARFDVQSIAPQLMMLPEGRKALAEFAPTYKDVGGQLYEMPRFGGVPTLVAGTKKRDTVTVGNVVLDKDTMQPLYTAPDKPAGAIQEFLDFQKLSGADKKAYIDLLQAKRPVSTTTVNVPTGEERKAAVLSNRLNFSVTQMNEAIGADPKAALPNTSAEIAKYITGSDFLANKLTPAQRQIVEAAQLDVLDAALTLGTGAAYTKEQLEGYRKSYFPQLGDKEEQIKTKQQRLQNILRSAEIASGRAASTIPTPIPSPVRVQPQAIPQDLQSMAREELEKRRREQ
jgi:hypothetical protein